MRGGAARRAQVFRSHKSQLRMQVLTGTAAQRGRILRAAFLVSPRLLYCATAVPHEGSDARNDVYAL